MEKKKLSFFRHFLKIIPKNHTNYYLEKINLNLFQKVKLSLLKAKKRVMSLIMEGQTILKYPNGF